MPQAQFLHNLLPSEVCSGLQARQEAQLPVTQVQESIQEMEVWQER